MDKSQLIFITAVATIAIETTTTTTSIQTRWACDNRLRQQSPQRQQNKQERRTNTSFPANQIRCPFPGRGGPVARPQNPSHRWTNSFRSWDAVDCSWGENFHGHLQRPRIQRPLRTWRQRLRRRLEGEKPPCRRRHLPPARRHDTSADSPAVVTFRTTIVRT